MSTTATTGHPSFSEFMKTLKPLQDDKSRKETKVQTIQKNENVMVNVSVVYCNAYGKITARRGTSLPVEVPRKCTAWQLKDAAQSKHAVFNKNCVSVEQEYAILYKDYEEVTTLPGTSQPFCLEQYQILTGKLYHIMTFYLCLKSDFEVDSENEQEDTEHQAQGVVTDKLSDDELPVFGIALAKSF
eukprot:gene2122-2408_t